MPKVEATLGHFGFRVSAFFRPSDFGLRVWAFALTGWWSCPVHPEAAAPEVFWLFHAVHDAMIAARNVVAKHRTMPGGEAADSEQSAPQVLERLVRAGRARRGQ